MRTARLDHNPMLAPPPITLASTVNQPWHVMAASREVMHPVREAHPAVVTIVADWVLMLDRLGNNREIAAWLGGIPVEWVQSWRTGLRSPDAEMAAALIALWNKRIGRAVPGLREAA